MARARKFMTVIEAATAMAEARVQFEVAARGPRQRLERLELRKARGLATAREVRKAREHYNTVLVAAFEARTAAERESLEILAQAVEVGRHRAHNVKARRRYGSAA
jgi:hypothetical protein